MLPFKLLDLWPLNFLPDVKLHGNARNIQIDLTKLIWSVNYLPAHIKTHKWIISTIATSRHCSLTKFCKTVNVNIRISDRYLKDLLFYRPVCKIRQSCEMQTGSCDVTKLSEWSSDISIRHWPSFKCVWWVEMAGTKNFT